MSTQFDLATVAAMSRQFGLAARTVKSSWLDLTTGVACLEFDLVAGAAKSRWFDLPIKAAMSIWFDLAGSGSQDTHPDVSTSTQVDSSRHWLWWPSRPVRHIGSGSQVDLSRSVSFSGQVDLSRLISSCDQVNPSRLIGSGGEVDPSRLQLQYPNRLD